MKRDPLGIMLPGAAVYLVVVAVLALLSRSGGCW